MAREHILSRVALHRLEEALADSPVVLVHGARQCGKSTLARVIADAHDYAYLTFDDETTRAAAESDPIGFIAAAPPRLVLDEVQRVPSLFVTLKAAVDRERRPGRFLLTGSANVLLLPALADSLAGRMEVVRLHPLSQREVAKTTARPGLLERLFAGTLATASSRHRGERLGSALGARIVAGGFPPALERKDERRRAAWYASYGDAVLQRDVRELAKVRSLDVMPKLLATAATQTARLFNVAELAAPFQLSRPTIAEYMTLLGRLFLVDLLPPWHDNRLSRLVKTPKLHMADTGLAAALLGVDEDSLAADRPLLGQLAESFVMQELAREASGSPHPFSFFHYRDKDQVEVDVVITRGAREVAGVEVKASATVVASDFRGLRRLAEITGARFRGGVVLHDGEQTLPFGDKLFAVPFRALWE